MRARPYPTLSDEGLVEFESRIIRTDGCHWWIGNIAKSTKYGYFGRYLAHRLAYVQKHGDVSAELHIDHLCRNKACVNPDHLEAVTARENVLRGACAGPQKAASHCKRGHPLSGENLYQNPYNGARFCRTCQRIRNNKKSGGRVGPLTIEVSPGELLDRISIAEIRIARLTDPEKVMRVHPELRALTKVWEDSGMPSSHLSQDIGALWRELWECNRIGWDLESKVRKLEAQEAFGTPYIESCRAIHRNNDKRSGLKRAINDLVGSEHFEEKLHS